MTPARTICLGFLTVIMVGALMLMLPISTSDGSWGNFITALFMSTSAVCVRWAAIKGLGNLRWDWCNWSVHEIATANTKILQLMQLILTDTDWSMRYAAIVALDALANTGRNHEAIALLKSANSQEPDAAVQLRIQMALQNLLVAT